MGRGWECYASETHRDLIRAPYCCVLCGVKYIDPVPLQLHATSASTLDLSRAPYVLYGVKYIGPVPLQPAHNQCLTP